MTAPNNTGRSFVAAAVTQAGSGQSGYILGIGARCGIAAIGSGSAQLQASFDTAYTLENGSPTWINVGSALTTNTAIGSLGYTASAVRLNVSSGTWTLQVAGDSIS